MQSLHLKITESVKEYRKTEAILIDLVQEADFTRFYLDLGYSSLFEYLQKGQGITAAIVSNLITVARKSVTIPEMKEAISKGEVGLAKLRKVSAVITEKNKGEWIEKSKTLSCRDLEKEVARVSTYKPRRDFWQRINSQYFRLSIDTIEAFKALAERAQDVYSKKCEAHKTLAEVFTWALNEALSKHDPIIKAERAERKLARSGTDYSTATVSVTGVITNPDSRAKKPSVTKRTRIPQPILNQVHFRDKGQCSFAKDGKRCTNKRYLHIHHIKPVKDGGKNTVQNLTTLCSVHHSYLHHREELQNSLLMLRQLRRIELGNAGLKVSGGELSADPLP